MEEPQKIHPVIVRIDAEKYRAIRHQLIDKGETFNGLVNKLLDEHFRRKANTTTSGSRQ